MKLLGAYFFFWFHPSYHLYPATLLSAHSSHDTFSLTHCMMVTEGYILLYEDFVQETTDEREYVIFVFLCLLPHKFFFL